MYVAQGIFAIIACSAPLLIAEALVRSGQIKESPHLRKIVHVAVSVSTIFAALLWGLSVVALAGAVFLLIFIVTRYTRLSWHSLDRHWQEKSSGDMAFAAGVTIAALVSSDIHIFTYIMLVVGVADTAGLVVGSYFKKMCNKTNQTKSLHGSLAVFIATLLIGMVVLKTQDISLAIVLALMVTIAERATPRGWDNATIPVVILLTIAL